MYYICEEGVKTLEKLTLSEPIKHVLQMYIFQRMTMIIHTFSVKIQSPSQFHDRCILGLTIVAMELVLQTHMLCYVTLNSF